MSAWWTQHPTWRIGITVRLTAGQHSTASAYMRDLIHLFRAFGMKYKNGEWIQRQPEELSDLPRNTRPWERMQ
jgi:hypothetical protein